MSVARSFIRGPRFALRRKEGLACCEACVYGVGKHDDFCVVVLNCEACQEAKRHAYSDATTPGFFYTRCEKHPAEQEAFDEATFRATGAPQ